MVLTPCQQSIQELSTDFQFAGISNSGDSIPLNQGLGNTTQFLGPPIQAAHQEKLELAVIKNLNLLIRNKT
jgi:hypothetical protein